MVTRGVCCCLRKVSELDGSDDPLLREGAEEDEDRRNPKVIQRNGRTVPVTTINVHPTGKPSPRPVNFRDIPSPVNGKPPTNFNYVRTQKGIEIVKSFREAYSWKDTYSAPNLEFSYKTNVLFNACEQYLSELSALATEETKLECDAIVQELLNLRAHWGTTLLPLSMRNAFVREKIILPAGGQEFRIDCIQFFEPIVFYGNSPGKQEDLVKLYVFVVNDVEKEEVLVRYYLERSFLFDYYHVLCFFQGNNRGQLKPYGNVCPSYWVIRQDMLDSAKTHLNTIATKNKQSVAANVSGMQPIAASVFPTPRSSGPVNV